MEGPRHAYNNNKSMEYQLLSGQLAYYDSQPCKYNQPEIQIFARRLNITIISDSMCDKVYVPVSVFLLTETGCKTSVTSKI